MITVTGAVTADAGQTSANAATAKIDGSATGIISGAIFSAESHVGGAVLATTDGHVTSSSLNITASGANTSNATTESFQIGGLSFSGAGTFAEVSSSAGSAL